MSREPLVKALADLEHTLGSDDETHLFVALVLDDGEQMTSDVSMHASPKAMLVAALTLVHEAAETHGRDCPCPASRAMAQVIQLLTKVTGRTEAVPQPGATH